MSVPAVHCEARKLAYRQSKEGLVVSFVIHPNDMPDALATAPLGQRYMLALAAIGDDEQPASACAPLRERPAALHSSPRAGGGAISPKERYASLPVNEQAEHRAGILPSDPRFRAWVQVRLSEAGTPMHGIQSDDAVQFIRDECCLGQSRKRIAEDPEAYDRFIAMETAFKIDVGELPEPR